MDTAIFDKYGLKPLEPLLETEQMTMWKMTQPAINRTVLVHVLGKSLTDDPEAVSYLFSVARSISNATAPAIAQIYTIFDEPDFKAIVSEYVDGLTLSQAIAALGPLSMKQTVRTGIAVAEALKDVWDSFHIIYGAARPEFVALDAGSTAKIISPCFAMVAPADKSVPVADMVDLGELMYFLATGVKPGQAHSVTLPNEFSAFLEKLTSQNPLTRFASWDNVLEALHALENIKPDAASAAPAGGGDGGKKKMGVKRNFGAPAGKVPKAVKHESSGRPAAIASRLALDPQSQGNSKMQAVRKAARVRAMAEDRKASGAGAKFFACILLVLVLGCVFVMRIGLDEFNERIAIRAQGSVQAPAEPETQTRPVMVDDSPAASTPAAPAASAAVAPKPAATQGIQDDDVDSLMSELDDDSSALNRYLAAHVGQEVPFIHKGVEHKVTLVSYTADTVTIRTRKVLTLKRSELTPEQLAIWK